MGIVVYCPQKWRFISIIVGESVEGGGNPGKGGRGKPVRATVQPGRYPERLDAEKVGSSCRSSCKESLSRCGYILAG